MTTLEELEARYARTRSEVDGLLGERRAALAAESELDAEATKLLARREVSDRVSGVLTSLGSERDAEARAQIERLVTAGLRAVFGADSAEPGEDPGEQLTFHLIEGEARGAAKIDFVVRTHLPDGEQVETDVLSARGGGVAAVIGLMLRVVLILLTRASGGRAPDLLVLDESLAMLSREHLDRAGQFLATLAASSGLQVLMVTHQPELAEYADVVYRFRLDSHGKTVAVREETC